ncbi:monocarboxylate transporter 13-like [Haliotis cracherodii]|uniref:monocarboxylate transporter 13-like n=1 Tax=Haliotis cracherodii TaxID=6455 RepID=UPI0039ED08F6
MEDGTGQPRVGQDNEVPTAALALCELDKGDQGIEKAPAPFNDDSLTAEEKQDGTNTLLTLNIKTTALGKSHLRESTELSDQEEECTAESTLGTTDITMVESPSDDIPNGRSSPATLSVEETTRPATWDCDGNGSTPKLTKTCRPHWKYLIVIGSFFTHFILEGSFNAFGVLFTDIWKYFGASKSSVALVGSLFVSLPLIGGAVASLIAIKLGCRITAMVGGVVTALGILASVFVQSLGLMYLTFGCLAGIGASFPYLACSVILDHHFSSKLGLVSGIAECGAGMGTVFMPIVFENLLVTYGWRGTLMILSAIMLNVCVCGALFQPASPPRTERTRVKNQDSISTIPTHEKFEHFVGETTYPTEHISPSILQSYCNENDVTTDKEKHFDIKNGSYLKAVLKACCSNLSLHVFTNPKYLLYTFAVFVFNLWVGIPYVYLSDKAIEQGVDKKNASFLLSIIGASQLVGCLLFGSLMDIRNINKTAMYCVTAALSGTALTLMPLFSTFTPLAILAAVFGLSSAPADSMNLVMLVDILGSGRLSSAYGYIITLKGFGELLGPPIAGLLYDGSGNYDNTFYAAGGCMIGCGVLYGLLSKVKIRRCTHHSPHVATDAPDVVSR